MIFYDDDTAGTPEESPIAAGPAASSNDLEAAVHAIETFSESQPYL
jgi:hypothetical protein